MKFTQIYRIVSFALQVDGDERGAIIALELVMRRKRLRRLSAQEPPLRAVCALALRHPTIVAMLESLGLPGCEGRR